MEASIVNMDFNSTTPIDSTVIKAMHEACINLWTNPSSGYASGCQAKKMIEESRHRIAKMINCAVDEIIFTSGATETNNWVVYSAVDNFNKITRASRDSQSVPHIITTNIEHDSVRLILEKLLSDGKIEVTFVEVSKTTGHVSAQDIINAIRPNTVLITVMLANNETGILQPVAVISKLLATVNERRVGTEIYLHTDASQAIGKINVDVDQLGVDYLTIVGHKFYGPRIGALYRKRRSPLHPIFFGGGQENGLRPDRQRFSRLDLNTNPSNDDISAERRLQLKLSFQPESIKTIIKPQALPERTRGDRIRMQASGKLQFGPEEKYDFTSDDLQDLGEIGRGAFGAVNKMIYKRTNTVMAVKRIRSTVDEKEQKILLMDLEVVMKSNDCNYIVQFYGALFKEGDCWICMELMDTSLDKFYKFVCDFQPQQQNHPSPDPPQRIPESILAKITVATVHALSYLKQKLNIIHRDVKPSNILLHGRGDIKLCDFGISGQLVDSIARTKDAGCRPYMAPERIDPQRAKGYDVRSDVWSLGITLMEVATGKFPYPKWGSVFEQLYQVVQGEAPRLTTSYNGMEFSDEFVDFVNTCLIKEESDRPKYSKLLQHPFIQRGERSHTDVAVYVSGVLETMERHGITMFTTNDYLPPQCWFD